MPKLGDYLGQLLSELTIARMKADLEAVRVAELYAGHPILRHMPVPHFRLPDVDLDVPVVITKMDEPEPGDKPHGAISLIEMRKTFDKILMREVEKEKIKLTPKHKSRIKKVFDEKVALLSQPDEVAVDSLRVASELTGAVTSVLKESALPDGPVEPESVKRFEAKLKEAARAEFIKLRKPPLRLHALVTTAEIREAGPSEVVTRLSLKITEDALEWTSLEADGVKKDFLVPE